MTDPSPAASKVQSTHSREELIATLSGDAEVYLAPYCIATRRLHEWLARELPHIKVLGYLDSYKQDESLSVWRIGEGVIDKGARIIIALERRYREDVISNIKKNYQSSIVEICALDFCKSAVSAGRLLYHIYDFSKLPNNYEFFYSLVLAEHERRRLGCTHIVTVFVNDNQRHQLYQYDRAASIASQAGGLEVDQDWFLRQVLIPGLDLIPASCGYQILGAKDLDSLLAGVEKDRIVNCSAGDWALMEPVRHYSRLTNEGGDLRYLQAPLGSRMAVMQWLETQKFASNRSIVITLREASYSQERNTDLSAWQDIAEKYISNDWNIVYVRDTFKAFSNPIEFPGVEFPVGPWNLSLRMGLYESVARHLSVNTGPAALSLLSAGASTVVFSHCEESSPFFEHSIQYHQRFPHAFPQNCLNQALVYGDARSKWFLADALSKLSADWTS